MIVTTHLSSNLLPCCAECQLKSLLRPDIGAFKLSSKKKSNNLKMHVKISGNNYPQTFRKISINRGKVVFIQ